MTDPRTVHFDHVGSLLRPKPLFAARERLLGAHDNDHNLGAHDSAALREIEDEHIRTVVALQEEAGLQFITDGDFRRRSWWTDFFMSLDGPRVTYSGKSPLTLINAKGETRPLPTVSITKRISWNASVNVAPFKFLQSVTTRSPKVTLPPPTMIHFQRDDTYGLDAYGGDVDLFWDDMIKVYRQEIAALAAAGCRQLQIDDRHHRQRAGRERLFASSCQPARIQRLEQIDRAELLQRANAPDRQLGVGGNAVGLVERRLCRRDVPDPQRAPEHLQRFALHLG